MKTVCLVAVLILGPLVGTARADSDGYYCAGRGYVAYQFGFAGPPVGPHRLYILRLGGASGIGAPVAIDLPQFQVQGMTCGDRSVRIAAYDAIYTVQLDALVRPTRYDAVPWSAKGRVPAEFVGQSRNLGAWSQVANTLVTDRVVLGPNDDGGRYYLEIGGAAIASERCASMITSRVVRTDRNDHEVQQLELFRGRGVRSCGGE